MFISNGDYVFPLSPLLYWLKHLFVWSFQTGAPNPDGIIRLPGRLFNLLVFQLGGNLAISYFYLIVSVVIVFLCFLYFSRKFVKIKSWPASLVVSTLFALNPAFLGNLAKVGLVMAAALLPLSLVFIRQLFVTKQLRYLLLYVILLNISLIHPYTFTVNLAISGIYFAYMAWRHWDWVRGSLLKFVGIGAVTLAMNLYFILPILALGSISKDVLSQDISDSPVDYTMLVDIANSGSLSNAFGLAKDVFKDFEFASAGYMPVYLIGVFGLYILLIWLFLTVEKQLPRRIKAWVLACFGATLVLLLFSTGTMFNIDAVIKFLINQPGGWTFRSPLKWQLYIPFFLCTALLLVLQYLPRGWRWRSALGGIAVATLLMNGYLLVNVYQRILVPRQIGEFAALQKIDMEGKTLLFANTETCTFYAQDNPEVFTEMNQVLIGKNVQVKRILADKLGSIGLSSYDYIISCQQSAHSQLTERIDFEKKASFAGNAIELYENTEAKPPVYTTTNIFALSQFVNVGAKQQLAANELEKDFHFIDETDERSSIGLYDAFDTLTPSVLKDDSVVTTVIPNNDGQQQLIAPNETEPVYYKKDDDVIRLSPAPQPDFTLLPRNLEFEAPAGKSLEFHYQDKAFDYKNIMPNHSFEDGLWQDTVGDCNAYDDNPRITMKVDKKEKTDGRQALRLEAQRHIACTGPDELDVEPGQTYLLSFNYKSSHPKKAGFYMGFNDAEGNFVSERMSNEHSDWQQFNHVVHVPPGATKMLLLVYAFPDEATDDNVVTHYDNIQFIKVPNLQDRFYIVSDARLAYQQPKEVKQSVIDPTRRAITVQSASTPFYLVLRESYHAKWRLSLANDKVSSFGSWLPLGADAVNAADHFKANNAVNAWYIDPAEFCRGRQGCTQNSDGSYTLNLVAEFIPQRWFYVGTVVSALTWIGVVGYLIYAGIRYNLRRGQKGRL